MLRFVALGLQKYRSATVPCAAIILSVAMATPIARQDASAFFLPLSANDQPLAVRITSGTAVERSADGRTSPISPIEARALVFPFSHRLVVESAGEDVTGSIKLSSQTAAVRINRRAKGDMALTVIEKAPEAAQPQEPETPSLLGSILSEEDGTAALKRGFLRKLPRILARFDASAPLSLASAKPGPARLADLSIQTPRDFERAHACLAQAIYFESRSEPVRGQQAVAQVVLNRVRSGFYPSNICGVIFQNKSWHNRCQFSFACDGTKKRVNDQEAWETANRIADDAIAGRYFLQEIGDATHYHAAYVAPRWRRSLHRVKRIGEHIFYTIPGVAINED